MLVIFLLFMAGMLSFLYFIMSNTTSPWERKKNESTPANNESGSVINTEPIKKESSTTGPISIPFDLNLIY